MKLRRAARPLRLQLSARRLAARRADRNRRQLRHARPWRSLDRDGVYGAPRFHMAAKKAGIRAHIGAEITCTDGHQYPLLAETRTGYQNLCRLITRMKLRAKKGEGAATPEELAEFAQGADLFITGTRDLDRSLEIFGRPNVFAEIQRHSTAKRKPATRPSSSRPRAPAHPAGRHQRRPPCHARAARDARRLHLRAQSCHAGRPPAACSPQTPSAI